MFTVLKPYAAYLFIQLRGIVATSIILAEMPVREHTFWGDTVNHFEPAKMKYRSDVTQLTEAIQEKEKAGWKLACWHIAYLSPDENKVGDYEDAVMIKIVEDK